MSLSRLTRYIEYFSTFFLYINIYDIRSFACFSPHLNIFSNIIIIFLCNILCINFLKRYSLNMHKRISELTFQTLFLYFSLHSLTKTNYTVCIIFLYLHCISSKTTTVIPYILGATWYILKFFSFQECLISKSLSRLRISNDLSMIVINIMLSCMYRIIVCDFLTKKYFLYKKNHSIPLERFYDASIFHEGIRHTLIFTLGSFLSFKDPQTILSNSFLTCLLIVEKILEAHNIAIFLLYYIRRYDKTSGYLFVLISSIKNILLLKCITFIPLIIVILSHTLYEFLV